MVVDIRSLYSQTGKFTYDPGFMSTAACKSAITYIDGDEGILLYRGYPDPATRGATAISWRVCYLLLKGELPSVEQKRDFDNNIRRHTMVHEQLVRFFSGLPPRRAPDGRHGRRGRRAVRVLSRLARHQ